MAMTQFALLTDLAEYEAKVVEVAKLFSTVFQRDFPDNTWRQWYFNNPYGNPIVAVGYSDGQLVGHHALIPQMLVGSNHERFEYCLSISTMVHPEHRSLNAFVQLLNLVHSEARTRGARCILGFPNSVSEPLFERVGRYRPIMKTELCNWDVSDSDAGVSDVAYRKWAAPTDHYSVPEDETYWTWRTSVNNAISCVVEGRLGLIYKVNKPNTLTVLDAHLKSTGGAARLLRGLARSLGFSNVRLTRHHSELLGLSAAELTTHEGYMLRYYAFPLCDGVPKVRFSLLLSDVF